MRGIAQYSGRFADEDVDSEHGGARAMTSIAAFINWLMTILDTCQEDMAFDIPKAVSHFKSNLQDATLRDAARMLVVCADAVLHQAQNFGQKVSDFDSRSRQSLSKTSPLCIPVVVASVAEIANGWVPRGSTPSRVVLKPKAVPLPPRKDTETSPELQGGARNGFPQPFPQRPIPPAASPPQLGLGSVDPSHSLLSRPSFKTNASALALNKVALQHSVAAAGTTAVNPPMTVVRPVIRTRNNERAPHLVTEHGILDHINYVHNLDLPEEARSHRKRRYSFILDPQRLEQAIAQYSNGMLNNMSPSNFLQQDIFGEVDDPKSSIVYFENDDWADIETMLIETRNRLQNVKRARQEANLLTVPDESSPSLSSNSSPSTGPLTESALLPSAPSEAGTPTMLSVDDEQGVDVAAQPTPHNIRVIQDLLEETQLSELEMLSTEPIDIDSDELSVLSDVDDHDLVLPSQRQHDETGVSSNQLPEAGPRKARSKVFQCNKQFVMDKDCLVRDEESFTTSRTIRSWLAPQKAWIPYSPASHRSQCWGTLTDLYARMQQEAAVCRLFTTKDLIQFWSTRLHHRIDLDILVGHIEDKIMQTEKQLHAMVVEPVLLEDLDAAPSVDGPLDEDGLDCGGDSDDNTPSTAGLPSFTIPEFTPVRVIHQECAFPIVSVKMMQSHVPPATSKLRSRRSTRAISVTAPETISMYRFLRQKTRQKKVVTFSEIAEGQSKADVARSFMQMLLLRTKGVTDIAQHEPFGEISIKVLSELEGVVEQHTQETQE
eukprot:Blabericola_migrator_1__13194@NODE_909_length_6106_cov_111_915218_g635_i0_p2_GENE_NODE_909_length_6106_cov_111_915218_g635_i0NODE_909_length_6106_cov_111_915218_g635_i0_p2_ORF_typecomplete_len773_score113_67Rad21_Rec8/PF04824_16/1_1e04Rad21_Rec8/PF04824_16/2_5e02Rad21_Rec8/PF04824_16/1e11SMC_ScpA/PF02616_14/1_1e04SMC_ScpA/PF02616_14/1_9e05CNDH2_C/PF16858_5/0_00025_NODE_909_length_6106_cov_111_915218_g635_i036695987